LRFYFARIKNLDQTGPRHAKQFGRTLRAQLPLSGISTNDRPCSKLLTISFNKP
jgi:hypothetical protein